jgi:hypothetical protein
MLVAVDVGRSATKVAYTKSDGNLNKFAFKSILAEGFNKLASRDTDTVTYYAGDTVSGLRIDNKIYLFDRYAEIQGNENALYFPEDDSDLFHQFVIRAVLYSIAKIYCATGETSIDLALGLTYGNDSKSAWYKNSLAKKHSVDYLVIDETGARRWKPVDFMIKSVLVANQGYCSIFNFLDGKEEEKILNGAGVVVDIGRHSVDFSLVREFIAVKGESVPLGTLVFEKELVERARYKGLNISYDDIDNQLETGSKVISGLNVQYSPLEDARKSGLVSKFFNQIREAL